jgi:hypothetical protein
MIPKAVTDWLPSLNKALINSYNKEGLRASGKWAKELRSTVTETSTGFKIEAFAPAYHEQLINGRQANSNQDKESLKGWVGWAGSTFLAKWVKDKGISASPYAVAWKIARHGVKVPNTYNSGLFVEKAITPELMKELSEAASSEIIETKFLKAWQ